MLNPLTKKEIPRRKWIIAYIKWQQLRNRGGTWVSRIKTIVNIGNIVLYATVINLRFPWIPYWILIVGMIIVGFLFEFVYYFGGWLDFKKFKIWKIEREWEAKTKEVNSTSVETIETLKSIAEKVGAKSYFTDLHKEK